MNTRLHLLLLPILALFGVILPTEAATPKTRNVFLITADGLRREEVFEGADPILITKEYGNIGNTNLVRKEFYSDDLAERRRKLFPFLWGTVATQGQLLGNAKLGSEVRVSNGRNFSYPGYNEFLTGIADPRITSNDKNLNRNTNVLEWLQHRPGFQGRVAATVNWDVIPWILNCPRSKVPVWSGFEVPEGTPRLEVPEALTTMVDHSKTLWSGVLLDTFVGYAATHTVRTMKPRAMYVAFGETDDWAHEGHYERYLRSAREFDRFIGELWTLVQSMPEYRGTTSFVITVDHGRGPAPIAWKNHGREIPDSAGMWMAILGPDTPALGERRDVPSVKQAQTAATVAALLGEDFRKGSPEAAPAIDFVF